MTWIPPEKLEMMLRGIRCDLDAAVDSREAAYAVVKAAEARVLEAQERYADLLAAQVGQEIAHGERFQTKDMESRQAWRSANEHTAWRRELSGAAARQRRMEYHNRRR